ncbi:MAG: sensor histidine kinase [Firmicutes bacterium]|nr:sensor histidine kinase [Bacillota bacterium]
MQDYTMTVLFLSRAVFLTTNILLLYIFLTPKRPLWFQIIALASTFITAYFLRLLLEPFVMDPILLGYIVGTLYLLPCMLIFKETLHAKIFVFFMNFSLSQFAFLIFLHIDRFLSPPIPYTFLLVGLLLEMASLRLISKYAKPPIRGIVEIINQQNASFTLFPILSFILLTFYGVYRTYLLFSFIPLVLCTMLIIFSYYLIAISIDRTRRHQQIEQQLALQRDHYHNLNSSITKTKAIRHDLRHHLVTISEFLGNKDAVSAQAYLNRLCNSYDDSSIPTVCRNQSADALICHYLKLAKQEDITFVAKLDLPDDLGIDDLDLCVIIGNCLENAIEACSKIQRAEPRFINIRTTICKGYLVFEIANSFNGLVQHQGDVFFSSKKGVDHGIGLSSVKTLAAKYHGHCSISLDQGVFKVSVSLQLRQIVAVPSSPSISGIPYPPL